MHGTIKKRHFELVDESLVREARAWLRQCAKCYEALVQWKSQIGACGHLEGENDVHGFLIPPTAAVPPGWRVYTGRHRHPRSTVVPTPIVPKRNIRIGVNAQIRLRDVSTPHPDILCRRLNTDFGFNVTWALVCDSLNHLSRVGMTIMTLDARFFVSFAADAGKADPSITWPYVPPPSVREITEREWDNMRVDYNNRTIGLGHHALHDCVIYSYYG